MRYILLTVILFICGCEEKKHYETNFHPQEKVCYIDDANLIGRVLWGPNGYGQYRVKWLSVSSHSPLLGGKVIQSPFSLGWNKGWELKSLQGVKIGN